MAPHNQQTLHTKQAAKNDGCRETLNWCMCVSLWSRAFVSFQVTFLRIHGLKHACLYRSPQAYCKFNSGSRACSCVCLSGLMLQFTWVCMRVCVPWRSERSVSHAVGEDNICCKRRFGCRAFRGLNLEKETREGQAWMERSGMGAMLPTHSQEQGKMDGNSKLYLKQWSCKNLGGWTSLLT